MSTKPTILILSTSLSEDSRSRAAARFAARQLREDGRVQVDVLDLAEHDVRLYPDSEEDPVCRALVERFNAAIGFVIAAPVHNWTVSAAATNFLAYALDREQQAFRPFVLLAGAGGPRSQLAFDGLSRMLTQEIDAVQVGAPVLCAEQEVDKVSGALSEELRARIQRSLTALVPLALTSARTEVER